MKIRLPSFIPRETLLMALDSVRAHKFRSALTVLGIVIGVIVSIVVASILTGLRANIVRMVEEYGTNNIYALHLTTGPQGGERDQAERARMPLTAQGSGAIVPDQSAGIVGTRVRMGGYVWEIIGVLAKRQTTVFGENEEDNAVFVPFRTGVQVAPGRRYLLIILRAKSGQLREAVNQVEEILRSRRNVKFSEPNNFDVKTADAFITQFDSIFGMIGIIAIAISSVGLLVGGIGVMNIMLVSVTERTAEIGVRKALGARRRDITSQFLIEAMTLTFLGGVIGVLAAVGISKLIGLIIPSLPSSIPLWAVISGLTVSVAIGLIFGVWPARKAARLDPIECLRYE